MNITWLSSEGFSVGRSCFRRLPPTTNMRRPCTGCADGRVRPSANSSTASSRRSPSRPMPSCSAPAADFAVLTRHTPLRTHPDLNT